MDGHRGGGCCLTSVVLVRNAALGGAKLYNFRPLAKAAVINLFETCFSTLLMDTTEVGKDAFVKITALGGVKLYKFTVKVAIISVLWEILIKLLTTLIWQKRHNGQCTVVGGDTSFLKTTNVFRGECRLCKVAKVMMNKNKKLEMARTSWKKCWEYHKNVSVNMAT